MTPVMNRSLPPRGVTRPPVAIIIIGICAALFGLGYLLQANDPSGRQISAMFGELALWPVQHPYFRPWQLVSYAFLHGGFSHILFNMFAVWMFGLHVEQAWGSRRFALFYLACVLGAAVTQLVVQWLTGSAWPTVGASGAVFGLLLAYGVMWPENRIYLIFLPVPIKAKWFVLIYAGIELFFGLTDLMPGIAHFAHLGGLLGGGALMMAWGWRPGMTWKR